MSTKTMRLARSHVADYMQSLDALAHGEKHYLPSGFNDLDKKFQAWLHEGHFVVIAGRPAMGKSAFTQQIVESVAAQNRTAILFTLEMSGHEITERAISRRSGVPVPNLKTATGITAGEWSRVGEAAQIFSDLPLMIDDGAFGIDEIFHKSKAENENLEKAGLPPLGCIAIDYMQLIVAKGQNRTQEVGQITSKLKRLAKELSVPVIGLSQLNRAVEGRVDRRPSLADLRESGNIEQDADSVMFIYRDEYYNPGTADRGIAEILVAKNRHGATGAVRMAFNGECVRFGDLAYV